MKNFLKLASGLDVMPLLAALQRHPELWNQNRFRTTFDNTPHSQVDDILLRFSSNSVAKNKDTPAVMCDPQAVWYPAMELLPEAKALVLWVMARLGAYQLDRLIVTRLVPGAGIFPHADNVGDYVNDPERQRLHLVVQGLPGASFRCGDELVTMLSGELWWFNALEEHECFNASADDRIHLLIDCKVWPSKLEGARNGKLG